MGIPKLFRWLTDQYPAISKRLDQGLNEVSSLPLSLCVVDGVYCEPLLCPCRRKKEHD